MEKITRLRKDQSKSKQAYQEKIVSIYHMQCNCRSILTIISKNLQGDIGLLLGERV